jgi:branched-chain amino acid transport system permease protein
MMMMQTLANAVTAGSIYLLFALGMSLTWGTINVLNFAHGAVFMFTAFLLYLVASGSDLNLPELVAAGAGIGAVLSSFIQVSVFEPIQRRTPDVQRAEMQMLVGGIGMASILLAIAQRETRGSPFGLSQTASNVSSYQILGAQITSIQLWIVGSEGLRRYHPRWRWYRARHGARCVCARGC